MEYKVSYEEMGMPAGTVAGTRWISAAGQPLGAISKGSAVIKACLHYGKG